MQAKEADLAKSSNRLHGDGLHFTLGGSPLWRISAPTVRTPRWAKSMPSVKPTGPPPMMSTCVSIWSTMEVLIAQFEAFAYALWKDGKNDSFRWAESEEEMPKGRAAADRRSSPLRDRCLSGGHSPHSGGYASAKTTVTIGAAVNAGMMSINSFALTERLLEPSRGPAMDRTAESREWVRV
jgi:hypothetical protein